MTRYRSTGQSASCGFSLIEAIAAMLLMAIILSALGSITSHWLPIWDNGLTRAQRDEMLSTGLNQLLADIGQAQFIPVNRSSKAPLFFGGKSQLVFVRTAVGPNFPHGLDIVRVVETSTPTGWQLVRERTEFASFQGAELSIDDLQFHDGVVIFRSPLRTFFSYANEQGVWSDSWHDPSTLPAAVQVNVRDSSQGAHLRLSSVAKVRVNAPASVVCKTRCDNGSAVSWDRGRLSEPATGTSR